MFCRDCRYSDYMSSTCRRRAPKTTVLQKGSTKTIGTKWPEVLPTDWCGEFSPMNSGQIVVAGRDE